MFENGFPREWSTIKKIALLFRAVVNAIAPVLKTVTGALIHITDALARPAQSLKVNFSPVQSGSGDPSPDNIRPISGWTEVKVTRTGENVFTARDGTDSSNGTTVVFASVGGIQLITVSGTPSTTTYFDIDTDVVFNLTDFGYSTKGSLPTGCNIAYASNLGSGQYKGVRLKVTQAFGGYGKFYLGLFEKSKFQSYTIDFNGTRYGGTLDVTSGKLTVDKAMVDWGTLSFNKYGADPIYYATIPNKANGITNILSDKFFLDAVAIASMADGGMRGYSSSAVVYFRRNDCPTLADWNTWLSNNPTQLCYELATPIEVTLTPTEITLFAGENNLWSDANGNLELTYLADGNASAVEALNIRLGGRYVNNHGEDEPTDREALNILLGGNER